MPLLFAGVPGGEAGYPAGDVGAVGLVLGAEGFAEGGLFVEHDEQVGGQPGNYCVYEEVVSPSRRAWPRVKEVTATYMGLRT